MSTTYQSIIVYGVRAAECEYDLEDLQRGDLELFTDEDGVKFFGIRCDFCSFNSAVIVTEEANMSAKFFRELGISCRLSDSPLRFVSLEPSFHAFLWSY